MPKTVRLQTVLGSAFPASVAGCASEASTTPIADAGADDGATHGRDTGTNSGEPDAAQDTADTTHDAPLEDVDDGCGYLPGTAGQGS